VVTLRSERSVADASSSPFVTIARTALGSVWGHGPDLFHAVRAGALCGPAKRSARSTERLGCSRGLGRAVTQAGFGYERPGSGDLLVAKALGGRSGAAPEGRSLIFWRR
jgi:hypothetical protein